MQNVESVENVVVWWNVQIGGTGLFLRVWLWLLLWDARLIGNIGLIVAMRFLSVTVTI